MTRLIVVFIFIFINFSYSSREISKGYNFRVAKRSSHEPTCPSRVETGKIIQTTTSIKNGAVFISNSGHVVSQSDCLRECCENRNCTLAVFKTEVCFTKFSYLLLSLRIEKLIIHVIEKIKFS